MTTSFRTAESPIHSVHESTCGCNHTSRMCMSPSRCTVMEQLQRPSAEDTSFYVASLSSGGNINMAR